MRADLVATPGQLVIVSDSGPRGWVGRVIAAQPGSLTVRRDNGGRTIIDVTRRTIQVCPDGDADSPAA